MDQSAADPQPKKHTHLAAEADICGHRLANGRKPSGEIRALSARPRVDQCFGSVPCRRGDRWGEGADRQMHESFM